MNFPELDVYLQAFGDTKDTRLTYYLTFLKHTDYVSTKIAEYTFVGKEVEEKYHLVLKQRENAREKIRELTNGGE